MSDEWRIRAFSGDPFDLVGSSFSALLRRVAPDVPMPSTAAAVPDHPEGTTIVAATYPGGVVMAGDRRATAGNFISKRNMRKVFQADHWSAVGIAGSAGPAMEMAKIFTTELEHYEKVEGAPLSLEGKANKLAQMVRANFPMALQGLVVVPLFAGYDPRAGTGRIFEYDAVGGRYEERLFTAAGSGGRDARGSMKARYREDMTTDEVVDMVLDALWDAADEDSATGGPDVVRRIYPLVAVMDADGYRERDEEEIAERFARLIDNRTF